MSTPDTTASSPKVEEGIGLKHGRYYAYVQVGKQQRFKRFPKGTALKTVRRWRSDTRYELELRQPKTAAGTFAADVTKYLPLLSDRPILYADRKLQLDWWCLRFGHKPRHSITAFDIKKALIELRTGDRDRTAQLAAEIARVRTHLASAPPAEHGTLAAQLRTLQRDHAAARPRSASTCNHYRMALVALWHALDGKLAPNPLREVPVMKGPKLEPRGQSYDIIRVILDAMSNQGGATPKGVSRLEGSKAKARCRVIAYTGMRHSELKRLQPSDWSPTLRIVNVRTGKEGDFRVVPLTDDAIEALREFDRLECYGTFSNSSLHRAFRRGLSAASLSGIRPYDLRHSFGTVLYAATGDLNIVAELMGHSSTKTTRRYTLGHVPEYARIAMQRFGELTQPGASPVPDPPDDIARQLKLIVGGRS